MPINQELSVNVLSEAASCFRSAHRSIFEGAQLLYRINSEELWKDRYSSFGEYVEQECQISQGMASKLLKVFSNYVIEGKMQRESIEGIDHEKLYLAIQLPMSPEERVSRAKTWTRQEIRDELHSTPEGDCKHECEHITICSSCRKRV